MNYIIKDGRKYTRVCFDNLNEQLFLVNDNFRIIIIVDNEFINKVDLAFLDRFEKINVSFDKLLDQNLKLVAKNLIEKIGFNKNKNIDSSLKNLLINCGDEDIAGLVYYFSKEIKDNYDDTIINKICKILPQDIISILPRNNIIVNKYFTNKTIYNYKDYINKEENKKYKISIIYTFSNIENEINGLKEGMNFILSSIRSEIGMKNVIEDIKYRNEFNRIKEYQICIHFQQSESRKIIFISNYILKNFKRDKYNYIFIIHIKRNNNNNERIYSLADVNIDINQLFIDDLNGNNNKELNK
jgi:hypothetical protein